MLPLSEKQRELLGECIKMHVLTEPVVFPAYSDEFDPLGTQESASRFDLGSGETDA